MTDSTVKHSLPNFYADPHKSLSWPLHKRAIEQLGREQGANHFAGGFWTHYSQDTTNAQHNQQGTVRAAPANVPPIPPANATAVAMTLVAFEQRKVDCYTTLFPAWEAEVRRSFGQLAINMMHPITANAGIGVPEMMEQAELLHGKIRPIEVKAVQNHIARPLAGKMSLADRFAETKKYMALLTANNSGSSDFDNYTMVANQIASNPELTSIYREFLISHPHAAQQTVATITAFVLDMVTTLGTETSFSEAAIAASASDEPEPALAGAALMTPREMTAKIAELEKKLSAKAPAAAAAVPAPRQLITAPFFCFCCGHNSSHTGSTPCRTMLKANAILPGSFSAAMIAAKKPGVVDGKPSSTAVQFGYKK